MTKRLSSKPASIGLLLAAALMELATLFYATHRRVVEYPMEMWDEGDDGWECCA